MAMEFMGYHLQPLPQDEVAIIDFSSSFPNHRRRQNEVTSFLHQSILYHQQQYNHFRNYRTSLFDHVDNIPYEQLLELEERIGNINTGLSIENITTCLNTRTVHQHHHISTSTSTSADLDDDDEEEIFNDTCIVCQDEYKDNDTIGTLKCGHEYHRDCIKEWLLLKNVCPICKRPALSTTWTS